MVKREMQIDHEEMVAAMQSYFDGIYREGKAPRVVEVTTSGYGSTAEFKIKYRRANEKPITAAPTNEPEDAL